MERYVIYWRPKPDDPYADEPGAEQALETMLNGPLPPEAYMDPDQLAADLFLGSVEIIASGWLPEPPDEPALAVAA